MKRFYQGPSPRPGDAKLYVSGGAQAVKLLKTSGHVSLQSPWMAQCKASLVQASRLESSHTGCRARSNLGGQKKQEGVEASSEA